MKIRERIARWLAGRPVVTAHYGGAYSSPNKAPIPGAIANARTDISTFAQLELLRKARYFEKNDPVVQKILDLIEVNCIGTGMVPTPATSDPEFNAAAKERFEKWVNMCDLTSRQSFYQLQAMIARAQAVDGEIFTILTYGDQGDARVQLVESHRVVDSKSEQLEAAGYFPVQGIYTDSRGRPAFYCIADDYDWRKRSAKTVQAVASDFVVHFWEPARAGQYRGLTLFHSVIDTLNHLSDIEGFEMIAVKDHASISKVIKTRTGVAAASNDIFADNSQSLDQRTQFYKRQYGGETVVLENGDDFAQFASDRPTVTTRDFWEYLQRRVCMGVGISYAALKDYSIEWGGAALRAAVISDSRFFSARSASLAQGFTAIYRHVIKTDIERGFLKNAPADWDKVKWHAPRRATADIGQDSAARINELRAGLRTLEDCYGDSGSDWERALEQKAKEASRVKELASKYQITPTDICALDPNERTAAAQQEAPTNAP